MFVKILFIGPGEQDSLSLRRLRKQSVSINKQCQRVNKQTGWCKPSVVALGCRHPLLTSESSNLADSPFTALISTGT